MALMPVDEALAQLLAAAEVCRARRPLAVESVALLSGLGRILASDVIAPINVPPERNSAMDGYAFCFDDLSHQQVLPVSQRIPAGRAPEPLQAGTAARIFTGGVLPEGADTVAMQENCHEESGCVQLLSQPLAGANIRAAGEDIVRGSIVLTKGTRLGPAHLGLLASIGLAQVCVFECLRVALLCTGDELVAPGGILASGQLFNSNETLLASLLQQQGCSVVTLGPVNDTLSDTQQALRLAVQQGVHLLVSTGGVSVGEEDHVRAAVQAEGQLDLWKVAIKPGKPLAFGYVHGVPFIGLPGNPQSVWVTSHVLALPFIRRLQQDASQPLRVTLPANFERLTPQSRREYLRVKVLPAASGEMVLEAYPHQGSGVLSSAAWADGLAVIEAGATVQRGQAVLLLVTAS